MVERMVSEWSGKTPTERGQYWYIGCPWDDESDKKELHYVSIRGNSSGSLFYITDGNFMENKNGLWMRVELPVLPVFPDGVMVEVR